MKSVFNKYNSDSNESSYIVLYFLSGKLRKFFLAGNEINENPNFVEETRLRSEEEVVVLFNTVQNRKRLIELAGLIKLKAENKRKPNQ
jgi:hypothetical protein